MIKKVSWVFGAIFVLAGILGFLTNPVLGFLAPSLISNVVHILVGIVLIAMAGKPSAGMTVKAVGIIYVVLAVLGFLSWTFMASSSATNWFYLVVGVVLAVLGWTNKGGASSGAPSMGAPASPQM